MSHRKVKQIFEVHSGRQHHFLHGLLRLRVNVSSFIFNVSVFFVHLRVCTYCLLLRHGVPQPLSQWQQLSRHTPPRRPECRLAPDGSAVGTVCILYLFFYSNTLEAERSHIL